MLYGFYNSDSFITNANAGVNPVGELSELGRTYSRTIETYVGTKGFLELFDLGTLTSNQQTALQNAVNSVTLLLDNIVNYNTSSGTLLNDMIAALGNTCSNVSIGNPILNPIDNMQYPEWIQFDTTQLGLTWTFKIWLANASFLAQYPLGQFEFVYPIANMQDLYNNFQSCKTAIQALDATSLILKAGNQIRVAVTGYDALTVRVFDRLDQTQYFDLPISVAYNGGSIYNNPAAYMTALKNALLAGGLLTLAEWLTVIPSLIPFSKYFMVVNWANAAVVNLALQAPICSPTIPVVAADTFAAKYFPDYTLPEVANFLDYTVAMYKSVGIYALPDLSNLDGRITFRNKFTDYFLVPLSDINIEQMSPATQNMAALLDQLIRFAESYVDGVTVVPSAMTIQTHGSYKYVCQAVDTTLLCVITRQSALA